MENQYYTNRRIIREVLAAPLQHLAHNWCNNPVDPRSPRHAAGGERAVSIKKVGCQTTPFYTFNFGSLMEGLTVEWFRGDRLNSPALRIYGGDQKMRQRIKATLSV